MAASRTAYLSLFVVLYIPAMFVVKIKILSVVSRPMTVLSAV